MHPHGWLSVAVARFLVSARGLPVMIVHRLNIGQPSTVAVVDGLHLAYDASFRFLLVLLCLALLGRTRFVVRATFSSSHSLRGWPPIIRKRKNELHPNIYVTVPGRKQTYYFVSYFDLVFVFETQCL